MEELKSRFPAGVDYAIVYDTTPFINESINEVFKTLRDAVILVAVVVLVFLQNWRSALIPLVAVPVAIIGTFAVMAAMGFSLNNLTLFGLVLAIGIVVDDAIVVVEAVEHHIEHGLAPRDATIKAMEQVSGPVIAVGLVLARCSCRARSSRGITGQFFRQFALTIAVSTVISAFNSLTLSPALAALLLRPRKHGRVLEPLPRLAFALVGGWLGWRYLASLAGARSAAADLRPRRWVPWWIARAAGRARGRRRRAGWSGRPLNRLLGWFFRLFNVGFQYSDQRCTPGSSAGCCGSALLVLLVYGGLLYLTYLGLHAHADRVHPAQDKGYLLVNVQLPDAASVERTAAGDAADRGDRRRDAGRQAHGGHRRPVDPAQRQRPELRRDVRDARRLPPPDRARDCPATRSPPGCKRDFQEEIHDGLINVFGAPPVEGLGTAGGFKIVIEDRGDTGLEALQAVGRAGRRRGQRRTADLQGLFTSFRANTPWLYLDIDREQGQDDGRVDGEVFNTLQVYLGSLYVNDFNRFGRTWQVNVQADANFRKQIEDLKQLKIRNDSGRHGAARRGRQHPRRAAAR